MYSTHENIDFLVNEETQTKECKFTGATCTGMVCKTCPCDFAVQARLKGEL